MVGERRIEASGGGRRVHRARGSRQRAGRPHLRRAVRRASRCRRRRPPRHSLGRSVRRRGHRHRAHRPGLRPGGLRAVEGVRPAGHRPDRPVRRVRHRIRLAVRPVRRGHGRSGGGHRAGRGRGPRGEGPACRQGELRALLPALLALPDAAHLPPRRRVVHRDGPAARVDQRLHPIGALAAGGDRAHGTRARLAAEHGRLDDQQEAVLRPGAAHLGVHRVRRLGGHRLQGRAARARRRRLGGLRRPLPASAVGRCRRDRLHLLRGRGATDDRRREPLAGRRDRGPLHAEVEHRSRLLARVVPGRLDQRVLPGPVPQLVLRAADRVDRDDRHRADADALRLRAAPRRERRGDAQVEGQLDPVRRGRRAHRGRRHALDVRRRQPGDEPAFRVWTGPRGGAPVLPAPVEHLRVPRHLRPARRMDARRHGRRRARAPCSTDGSCRGWTPWWPASGGRWTSTTR